MKKPLSIAFLGSGNGTSLKGLVALHDRLQHPLFNLKLVIGHKPSSGILAYGQDKGFKTVLLPSKGVTRDVFDSQLDELLRQHEIELLVLVGYMRILSAHFTDAWEQKIINVHPSLLPKHKGLMDLAVHAAVINHHEKTSGCTVHYVTDKVDGGPILIQKECQVDLNETPTTLKQKVQALEPQALLEAITQIGSKNE